MAIACTYMNADAFWTHFSQHNSIFKTQKVNISVSVYRSQGTDASQICYYYCPIKNAQEGKLKWFVLFLLMQLKVKIIQIYIQTVTRNTINLSTHFTYKPFVVIFDQAW